MENKESAQELLEEGSNEEESSEEHAHACACIVEDKRINKLEGLPEMNFDLGLTNL